MKLPKIVPLTAAASLAAGLSLFGVAGPASADVGPAQPVTFTVASGALSLSQTAAPAITLVEGTAVDLPVTSVVDGRNDTARSGAWTVTAEVTDLVAGAATIPAGDVAIAASAGGFDSGTGTVGTPPADVLVSVTADSIDSAYSFTPTATLATQSHPFSGTYEGTVTQTVV